MSIKKAGMAVLLPLLLLVVRLQLLMAWAEAAGHGLCLSMTLSTWQRMRRAIEGVAVTSTWVRHHAVGRKTEA